MPRPRLAALAPPSGPEEKGLRDRLAVQPFLRNADYRELFGVTRFSAVRELRRLVQEGYLRLEGERRGPGTSPVPRSRGPDRNERYELLMCAHNSTSGGPIRARTGHARP